MGKDSKNKLLLKIMVYEYCPGCYNQSQQQDLLDILRRCKKCGSNLRRYNTALGRDKALNCEDIPDFIVL